MLFRTGGEELDCTTSHLGSPLLEGEFRQPAPGGFSGYFREHKQREPVSKTNGEQEAVANVCGWRRLPRVRLQIPPAWAGPQSGPHSQRRHQRGRIRALPLAVRPAIKQSAREVLRARKYRSVKMD